MPSLAKQASTLDADMEEWEASRKRKTPANNEARKISKLKVKTPQHNHDANLLGETTIFSRDPACQDADANPVAFPRVTPLTVQPPKVALLLQMAEKAERDGIINSFARERFEACMRQFFDDWKPTMATVDTLGFEMLNGLCHKLQIGPPSSFEKMEMDKKRGGSERICSGKASL